VGNKKSRTAKERRERERKREVWVGGCCGFQETKNKRQSLAKAKIDR